MAQRLAQKVLLIGWDAADWKHITPLLDQGGMPNLERLIDTGVMGNIATLQPVLSPMLWNSIATGKRADQHGVLGFTEPDPHTGKIRPVSSTSRKIKAIWNILTQRGFKTHVVGWWASHPAEPISGIAVSNLFPHFVAKLDDPWPMPDNTVHPAELADTFADLRVHPGELDETVVLPFIPRAAEIDQGKDRRLAILLKLIAECCSIHNAATWILQNQEWDFLAVYNIAIDHFCHGFINYHPPRMEGMPEADFEMYKDVVTGAYRFHDLMLGTMLALAGPDVTVMIVSDHGFHSDHLRPRSIPKVPAGPAVQHRQHGIFCLNGPHIKQDERIYGANLLDVTPTILHLFGLPVGQDMPGRALIQALEISDPPDSIPNWELEPGECGMHPADAAMDPAAAQAILQQFVALGYIEPLGEDQEKAIRQVLREQNFNLAQVHLGAQRPGLAVPLLASLVEQAPDDARYTIGLAQCYFQLKQTDEAERLLLRLLEGKEKIPRVDLLMGMIAFEKGDTARALEHLLRAEEADPQLPALHLQIGSAYLKRRRWADAERAFGKALAIDPDSPQAHLGLAIAHLRQDRNAHAADEALTAVGLQHFLPNGHYYLGLALLRMGQWERAILAFETCVSLSPGMLVAHRLLAALYNRPLGDPAKADAHRERVRELKALRKTQ